LFARLREAILAEGRLNDLMPTAKGLRDPTQSPNALTDVKFARQVDGNPSAEYFCEVIERVTGIIDDAVSIKCG